MRICRSSFQLSSALSSSLFLREPITFKTSPAFLLRASERRGQSQSANLLFPTHYSASDHLVRWCGWDRPRNAALVNWATSLFLACPHKSAVLGNLPLGRATVNLGFFTVPLSLLGICSRCDLKCFRLFFDLNVPKFSQSNPRCFHGARADQQYSTCTIVARLPAHLGSPLHVRCQWCHMLNESHLQAQVTCSVVLVCSVYSRLMAHVPYRCVDFCPGNPRQKFRSPVLQACMNTLSCM